jgi:hypothetical protein
MVTSQRVSTGPLAAITLEPARIADALAADCDGRAAMPRDWLRYLDQRGRHAAQLQRGVVLLASLTGVR